MKLLEQNLEIIYNNIQRQIGPKLVSVPRTGNLERNRQKRLHRLEIIPFLSSAVSKYLKHLEKEVCIVPAPPSRGSPSRG